MDTKNFKTKVGTLIEDDKGNFGLVLGSHNPSYLPGDDAEARLVVQWLRLGEGYWEHRRLSPREFREEFREVVQ
tara:strand:- start:11 stop:232 length:222 start_codon:yes stop_codon:yes gene_type:complete